MYKGTNAYLFTSERLGFRNWCADDVEAMFRLNNDSEVMAFFPTLPSREKTLGFVQRMQQQFIEKGFCYFPVELLETNEFVGFIGLSIQKFTSDFTPCTDIGWRLHKKFWGKGLASEGAQRCLKFAQEDLQVNRIYAMAPKINTKSIGLMKRLGMTYVKDFEHPDLLPFPRLQKCVLYDIRF